MLIGRLSTGEEIHRYQKSIVVCFDRPRRVLSTAPHHGGLREDVRAVYNNDCTVGAGMAAELRAPTYEEHVVVLSRELGLDPAATTGIGTAAQMENVSIKSESYKGITVTAVVTGGVEINGGRAGDPASWDELGAKPAGIPHGTINILLFCNVNLTPGALVRSLVTCTEAKTAALQELMASSRYSRGLATGSGTDGTIIVANPGNPVCLENAGKHCKLGELIGKTVNSAVKEALYRQTGMCAKNQLNVLRRVDRLGITAESIWKKLEERERARITKARYHEKLEELFTGEDVVLAVSLIVHVFDQLQWGLIPPAAAGRMTGELIKLLGKDGGKKGYGAKKEGPALENEQAISEKESHAAQQEIIDRLENVLVRLIGQEAAG